VRVGRVPVGSSLKTCPLTAGLYAFGASGMLRRYAYGKVEADCWDMNSDMDEEDEYFCKEEDEFYNKFKAVFALTYEGSWYEEGGEEVRERHTVTDLGGFRTGPDDRLQHDAEVLLVPRVCATPFGARNKDVSVARPESLRDLVESVQRLFVSDRRSVLHGHHSGVHDIGEMSVGVVRAEIEQTHRQVPGLWEQVAFEKVAALDTGAHFCHLCSFVYITDRLLSDVDKVRKSPLFCEPDRGYFSRATINSSESEDMMFYNQSIGACKNNRQLQTEFSATV